MVHSDKNIRKKNVLRVSCKLQNITFEFDI